ncbi:hypothetical protein B9479_003812 [Cryptococcus floricola]|uniref:Uncharacterized protein n=1 Tax=Cryptococcus floricola TaxID=2591691 RepID=A0A5D3AZR5_9TREE|nr:hypothetical protein B9479_003812 [Cryptococcus floricola]
MSDKKQNSPVPHLLAILLTLISTVFLFLVVLYNVPLSSSDRSNLSGRMWLLTVKPATSSGGDSYGFGIWGWCSWSDGGDGDCTNDSFWKITSSTEDVGILGLPKSIAQSMSTAAFLLTFNLVTSILLLCDLLYTIHFHSHAQPRIIAPLKLLPPKKIKMRTWHAQVLRNLWVCCLAVVFLLAWSVPVIVIVGVGAGDVDESWRGKVGLGWIFALIATILLIAVRVLLLMGGLWNNPSHSGRKK